MKKEDVEIGKRKIVSLEYITCPKCKEKGLLCGVFTRSKTKWRFDKFKVQHVIYNPKKRKLLREEGITIEEIERRGMHFDFRFCYLTKDSVPSVELFKNDWLNVNVNNYRKKVICPKCARKGTLNQQKTNNGKRTVLLVYHGKNNGKNDRCSISIRKYPNFYEKWLYNDNSKENRVAL